MEVTSIKQLILQENNDFARRRRNSCRGSVIHAAGLGQSRVVRTASTRGHPNVSKS